MGTVTTRGFWESDAWRGYGDTPLPTPERGRLCKAHGHMTPIAEGSGEAMLAVARLYGYDQRDFLDCVQRYGDPDTWRGVALRRLTWVPPETREYPSGFEHDASDWARWGCDVDGHAQLRELR